MKRALVVVAGLTVMVGSSLALGQFRDFQTGDSTIEARVLNVDTTRGFVELELRNKQRMKVKSSIFSEEDQSYIRDFSKVQTFQALGFKIKVEKNVLDKSTEQLAYPKIDYFEEGHRTTESICYDININNNTGLTMDGVTIAYNIFYEQEEVGQGKNTASRLFVDGVLNIEPLAPRQKISVQTAKYEIYKQRQRKKSVGLISSEGPYMQWRGKSKGIWLKIHLNTPSGLSAMREVCLPQNTNEQFEWQTSVK